MPCCLPLLMSKRQWNPSQRREFATSSQAELKLLKVRVAGSSGGPRSDVTWNVMLLPNVVLRTCSALHVMEACADGNDGWGGAAPSRRFVQVGSGAVFGLPSV